jgi:murein L,D-transpeptidase YafK
MFSGFVIGFVFGAFPLPASADSSTQASTQMGSVSAEVPASLIHLGNGKFFSSHGLVVDKKRRVLSVWQNHDGLTEKVKEYPSDLGKKDGVKVSRGDYRTPEGIYFFQKMLEGSGLDFNQYGKRAFTTNYPNLFDQRSGKTGNGIWLHAIPEKETLQRGSKGCVVVRNDSILDVSQFIQLHTTPFVIFDEAPMVSSEEQQKKYKSYQEFIENWRKSWESKDMAKYMSVYSDNFETNGMNRQKWEIFKKSLAEKYQSIRVQFSEPVIVEYKDQVIIRTLQRYRSDQKEDFGEKDIYLSIEDGKPKIIAEQWLAVTDPGAQAEIPSDSSSGSMTTSNSAPEPHAAPAASN